MDGDGVVACGEAVVGGGGVAWVVLAIDEIIRRAGGVNVLNGDGTCGTKVNMEFVQVFIIGHNWWLNVNLIITMAIMTLSKNNFSLVSY